MLGLQQRVLYGEFVESQRAHQADIGHQKLALRMMTQPHSCSLLPELSRCEHARSSCCHIPCHSAMLTCFCTAFSSQKVTTTVLLAWLGIFSFDASFRSCYNLHERQRDSGLNYWIIIFKSPIYIQPFIAIKQIAVVSNQMCVQAKRDMKRKPFGVIVLK